MEKLHCGERAPMESIKYFPTVLFIQNSYILLFSDKFQLEKTPTNYIADYSYILPNDNYKYVIFLQYIHRYMVKYIYIENIYGHREQRISVFVYYLWRLRRTLIVNNILFEMVIKNLRLSNFSVMVAAKVSAEKAQTFVQGTRTFLLRARTKAWSTDIALQRTSYLNTINIALLYSRSTLQYIY